MKTFENHSRNLRQRPRRPRTRMYVYDKGSGKMLCFRDPANTCFVKRISVFTTYSDEKLEDAAEQINNILDKAEEAQKDESKHLSILETPKGLFLAWTNEACDEDDFY